MTEKESRSIKKEMNGNMPNISTKELVSIFDNIEYYARRCENSQDCGNCDCPWCYNQQMDFERWLKQKYGNED